MEENNKMNIYGPEWESCQQQGKDFKESDIGKHYEENFCLKPTGQTTRESTVHSSFTNIEPYITNNCQEILEKREKKLCVLPKGHSGPCCCNPKFFITNEITKKIYGKTDTSIFSTPGADGDPYKNRASRLFSIPLTSGQAGSIRQPQGAKLKCAIPLKEQSTPFMLATALIDWNTYLLNIDDIQSLINTNSREYKLYQENNTLCIHKDYLIQYFNSHNRKVFDEDGYTICPIINKKLEVSNIADITRDNRFDIHPHDIQLGHISSRCDECYTIYGTNLLMMTREGNRIIGEYSFIENEWIQVLSEIVERFS